MPAVQFDYATWILRYPEFAAVTQQVAQLYFNEAGLYLRNGVGTSPIADAGQQSMLMNMLTAHIAAMNGSGVGGAGASPLVGPIVSATEGSVSVQVANNVQPGTMAWFLTTRYGAEFWAATAAYRTARYVPPVPRGRPFYRGF